jgi:hypothetical protein
LLLSLLRLTRWRGRPPAVLLLALMYAWAFVALDVTHTHATAVAKAVQAATRVQGAAPASQHRFTGASTSESDAPCPVCAAVHAAAVALVQPPAAVHSLAPSRRFAARQPSFTPTYRPSTLHLRGPPQA